MKELERAGDPKGQQLTSDAHRMISEASDRAGVQYAAGMSLGLACNFATLLLVVGYTFGLPKLSTKRTFVAGIVLTAASALFPSVVQPIIGNSTEMAFKAGVGLWLFSGVLFLVLVFIVWGVRWGLRSRLLAKNTD